MSRRFLFGLLPLACLAISLAGCKPPKDNKGTKLATGTEQPSKTVVCPRVVYADYKTYRAWYAEECVGTWVSLNTTKDTPAMCPGGPGECVEFTKGKEKIKLSSTTAEKYHHEPALEGGIAKASKALIACPPSAPTPGYTVTKLSEAHAYLETSTGGAKVFVMIFRVRIENLSDPSLTRTFGTGVEVTEDPGMGAPVIMRNQFTNTGQVCDAQHGGASYQIVLDSSTTIGP